MKFPSLDFILALQQELNNHEGFNTTSRWSDVKVLLCFGEHRYWLKLYGGKIIDAMAYQPLANPLGWDYTVAGELDAWAALRDSGEGSNAGAALMNAGRITVDGNMLQANRMYESTYIMIDVIRGLR